MQSPVTIQRHLLPSVGVLLQCLDADKEPLAKSGASGFIRRESDGLFLYTCWHVVSGFDPNDIRVGLVAPARRYLRIAVQAVEQRAPGIEVVGGLQTLDLPLYDTSRKPNRPTWLQDNQHVPNPDLNAMELFVPFWHDAVKLKLPDEFRVSDLQLANHRSVFEDESNQLVSVGEKCFVVGYPYGSAHLGKNSQPPLC